MVGVLQVFCAHRRGCSGLTAGGEEGAAVGDGMFWRDVAAAPILKSLFGRGSHFPKCGRICMGHRKINLSIIFAGQVVGVREVADKIWLVSFMDFDLGFFDEDCGRVEPAPNPFLPTMV